MKLRATFLGSKEPRDWEMGQGADKRSGKTYRISLLLENVDTVLLKVPEDFYMALLKNNIRQFAVLDVVFESRVTLEVNRNGRPEQLLKIVPVTFEVVAASAVVEQKKSA